MSFLLLSCGLASAQVETVSDSIVKQDLAKNAEYFSKGLENKYIENYDEAIRCFETALKFYEEDDASMYELAELYQLKNQNTNAYSMIYNAANLKPDNKWYQIRLAQFYLNNSDYQQFMKIYDKLMADDPTNLEYLETYIDVLLKIGDYDKAIAKIDVLEDVIGKNELIYLQKIDIYKAVGDTKKMTEEMEKLIELAPTNTRYLAMMAQLYRQTKKDAEAYIIYLKIKELDPDDKYINVSLYDYYQSKGEIEKAQEEFIAAIKNKNLDYETKVQIYELWSEQNEKSKNSFTIRGAESVGQAFIETHPDKNIGYYIMGAVCYDNKDLQKAHDYFVESMNRDKNNFATLYQLCLVEMDLKDYQSVIQHTELAISLYPEQPLFYLFAGLSYYNLKDYENTIKYLEKGRKLSANKDLTKDFDIYIGDTYNLMDNRKKSYEAYDRVLRADPENIYVLNNYAYYLSLDNQDLEKALEMSAKTILAEPKNATYLDTYAWILYKMNRFQEAKKWMDKCFKYEKNPSGVNFEHLGDILYKLGDTKKALQNWKKAKKAGDASELIDKKIKDEKLYE